MRRQSGFTLIEVMIVAAIIAILAAIAIPSYSEYVLRSRVPEGLGALSSMRVKLEQQFQDDRKYTNGCTSTSISATPTDLKYFAITCDLADTTYTVTAKGIAAGPMKDFEYTVNEKNAHVTVGVYPGWAKPSPNTCWALTKSGSC